MARMTGTLHQPELLSNLVRRAHSDDDASGNWANARWRVRGPPGATREPATVREESGCCGTAGIHPRCSGHALAGGCQGCGEGQLRLTMASGNGRSHPRIKAEAKPRAARGQGFGIQPEAAVERIIYKSFVV